MKGICRWLCYGMLLWTVIANDGPRTAIPRTKWMKIPYP